MIVSVVSGRVSVEQPSRHRFVGVGGPVALRVGGFVDASAGVASVRIATRSATYTAQLSRGSAQVLQARSGTTTFTLTRALACAGADRAAKRTSRHSRSLWVTDRSGPFVSRGSYVSAAGRGARRITSDYCGRTTVRVLSGRVAAKNLVTRHAATVTAGHTHTATTAAVPPGFIWSVPEPISNGGGFTAVSCAPAGFCAAVNQNGDLVTSSDPTRGPSTWTTTSLVSDIGLSAISCPTAQFCAAADGLTQDVLVSTDPTGGAGAWTATTLPAGGPLTAISCPTPACASPSTARANRPRRGVVPVEPAVRGRRSDRRCPDRDQVGILRAAVHRVTA